MFAITRGKGFHMTFANGWTISVQFGNGNYCDNRWSDIHHSTDCSSSDAEIAAWDANDEWYRFDTNDTVEGYQTPEQVLAFMQMIAAKPASEPES